MATGGFTMSKTFFIDLDDTLMPNQHYYKIAQGKMANLIVDTLWPVKKQLVDSDHPLYVSQRGKIRLRRAARDILDEVYERGYRVPPIGEIVEDTALDESGLLKMIFEKEQELDLEGVKKYKALGDPYHRERFPKSCMDTYFHFCDELGVQRDEEIAIQIYKIGESFWKDVTPSLMWGAARVLDFLFEKGDEMHILTKGDEVVQRHKMEVNKLWRWIPEKRWHIVSDKDTQVFKKVSKGMDLSNVYMIGNSQKSDINPAIEVGANGIYVPFYTWIHEESHEFSVPIKEEYALDNRGEVLMLETGRKVFVLPNIKDIMDLYNEL